MELATMDTTTVIHAEWYLVFDSDAMTEYEDATLPIT